MRPVVPFSDIASVIRDFPPFECDAVVGIATGGTVPASLMAYHLRVPLYMIWFNYRDDNNAPLYEGPRLLRPITLPPNLKHVLLVDDVAVTGKTLREACYKLSTIEVTTLVLKGRADIVLMPDLDTCVQWPWHYYCDNPLL